MKNAQKYNWNISYKIYILYVVLTLWKSKHESKKVVSNLRLILQKN